MSDVVLAHRTPLVAEVLTRALRLAGLDARAADTSDTSDANSVHVNVQERPTVVLRLDGSGQVTPRHFISDLVAAVRHVAEGRPVASLFPSSAKGERALPRLTAREREVLALLADGRSNDAMAVVLAISPNTVRTHVQNLLAKLEVDSRLAAAALARRSGLLPVASR